MNRNKPATLATALLAASLLAGGCSTTAFASPGDKAKWCGTFTGTESGSQITTMANGHARWQVNGREYYMDWEQRGRTLKFTMLFFSQTLELDNTIKAGGETLYPMYEADGDLFYYTYQPGKCN